MNILDYLYPKIEGQPLPMPSPMKMDFSNIQNAQVAVSNTSSEYGEDNQDFLNYMAHQQGVAGTKWIEKAAHGEKITPEQEKTLQRNMSHNVYKGFYQKYGSLNAANFLDYWRNRWVSTSKYYPSVKTPYDADIMKAAQENGLSPAFLKTVIGVESGFDPNAQSGSHKGLLQIDPSEAKDLGLDNPFDPIQSIYKGARLLSQRRYELFK